MRRLAVAVVVGGILASAAGAFLVSNALIGSRYVFEYVPANRRPINLSVDTEAVPGVADPLAVTQAAMEQWNSILEADPPFGTASAGGPYNGTTVGSTFGTFTNTRFEAAWDDTGDIFAFFGLSPNVLGITLKSVDTDSGQILDMLVVINTQPGALVAPGTGATAEQLFHGTLLHELGHGAGLAHTAVGMVNTSTFGLAAATPQRMPTMYAFRFPLLPQEGGTLEMDDVAGLIDIYPLDTSGLGSISGTVRGASGAGVNQIAVRAVGPAGAGEGHVGTLTDADASGLGRFTIPNLPPGPYRVVVEAVNGRGSVTGDVLMSSPPALGTDPFVYAQDEFWQPGDAYDPADDLPADFELVYVRAGRDTGSIDFVLNAMPLMAGPAVAGTFAAGDAQLPDAIGGFHYVDYYVFAGTAGQPVMVDVVGSGAVPQLRILRPSDLAVEAEDLPVVLDPSISLTLPETGAYTVAVSARATTGNPGGTGGYTLTLSGASGTLPPTPAVSPADVASMPVGDLAFASPVCDAVLLHLRVTAPSNEELWIDGLTLGAQGTASDAIDVTEVAVVEDRNGNGQRDSGEPVLATGKFTADNGTIQLRDLGLKVNPGEQTDLLVVCDVAVKSVTSSPQEAGLPWWLALTLLPLAWKRWGSGGRRIAAALLVLPLLFSACGGGGGSGCNGTFDPAGAIVTLDLSVAPGGLEAYTPTTNPATPLALPASELTSATLSVSN